MPFDDKAYSPASWTIRSETLDERLARLSHHPVPDNLPTDKLLAPWAKVFGREASSALDRRLSWDGVGNRRAAFAFCRAEDLPAPPRPAPWTDTFKSFLEFQPLLEEGRRRGRCSDSIEEENQLLSDLEDRSGPIPFVELWLPWIRFARDLLADRCPSASTRIASAAQFDWQAHLLRRIATIAELAALEVFNGRRQDSSPTTTGSGLYRRFVADALADPWANLYDHFPVLARQLSELTVDWTNAVARMVTRLDADRRALAETFGGSVPEQVARLDCGLSDPHAAAQEIMRLRLDSGLVLAYKPRCLTLEHAFEHLLCWLQRHGLPATPPVSRVLSRDDYGWQEWLQHDSLGTSADEYYRCAGALVALAYALRARDLHAENVVATAGGPTVVDVEMLLQPIHENLSSHNGAPPAVDCLESGLLIQVVIGHQGRIQEWGGLRPEPRRRGAGSGRKWTGLGTDSIQATAGALPGKLGANVFWQQGRPTRPEDYAQTISIGFEETYRFLLQHRDELLASDGPLEAFRNARVRLLLRPSQDYATALTLLAAPRNQRLGLRQSLLCEALQAGLAENEAQPKLWPLAADERCALLRRDIPRFTVASASTEIFNSAGRAVRGFLQLSGFDAVRKQIAALDEEDLARQLDLIRRALRPAESLPILVHSGEETRRFVDMDRSELGGHLRSWSGAIADCLLSLELEERMPAGDISLQRGRLGLALFLAAVARDQPEVPIYRETALRLAGVEDLPPPELNRSPRAGGFSGLGSVLYCLTWLAILLREERLLEMAAYSSRAFDNATILDDTHFDVERGVSGAILSLLTLYAAVADAKLLKRARRCGEYLIERQQAAGSGGAGWRASSGLMLTGFAHGQAGIARALFALAEVSGEERYRVAAVAALGYERTMFDAERGNWPVLLVGKNPGVAATTWRVGWCHGAPGIALARLYTPVDLRDDPLRRELESALATTAAAPDSQFDHLCCGQLGRSAILDVAAERLTNLRFGDMARRLTARTMDRAVAAGAFRLRLDPLGSRELQPGFLKGLPGIGYHFLRLAGDRGLPDVLALESPTEARARSTPMTGSES